MKIAILTSGILPVPAVRGGAVENLIDFYLEYNEQHRLHDITVYSVNDEAVVRHPALRSEVNHYRYVEVNSLKAKVAKRLYHLLHCKDEYYHYTIEYFLHEVVKDIRHCHYDAIILENRPGYALKLKTLTDVRLIYHLHNDKLNDLTADSQEIYAAATAIFTVSNFIKGRVQTINPLDTKTHTIYNGINLSAFSSSQEHANRALLGLLPDDFVILFSGRVTREKGIMQLIEAMTLLSDYPKIKLLVIGSSFYGNADNNNDFARALKAKAEPLQYRICFTGFVPYDQMPVYLQQANVAVIPSVWDDPFPTTVLEAQAMGLPVISTRRGGIPEEVIPESAILLDADEHLPEHIKEAVLDLYHHPEKRKAMGMAAKKRSLLFSKERYAKDFFDTLSRV